MSCFSAFKFPWIRLKTVVSNGLSKKSWLHRRLQYMLLPCLGHEMDDLSMCIRGLGDYSITAGLLYIYPCIEFGRLGCACIIFK